MGTVPVSWADLAHRRLRAWGLNTIANWSSPEVYGLRRTPYTLCRNTQGAPRRAGSKGWWGPLPDPENPAFERLLRKRAQAAAKTMREDPWCLGVFVDNELSWNDLPDLAQVADAYFSTVARILREALPNHLYLGSQPDCLGLGPRLPRGRPPLRRRLRQRLRSNVLPRPAARCAGQAHDQRRVPFRRP